MSRYNMHDREAVECFLPGMHVAESSSGYTTIYMHLYKVSMNFPNLDSIRDSMFTNAPHLSTKQVAWGYL
jgi:hypothetical protein